MLVENITRRIDIPPQLIGMNAKPVGFCDAFGNFHDLMSRVAGPLDFSLLRTQSPTQSAIQSASPPPAHHLGYQPELDIVSLKRRIEQIRDQRNTMSRIFDLDIPLDKIAKVKQCMVMDVALINKYTIGCPKIDSRGMSVHTIKMDTVGNIVKSFSYFMECLEFAYMQYQLAQYGLAPVMIKLPDLHLNKDFSEYLSGTQYDDKYQYTCERARTILVDASIGNTFSSESMRRMQDILYIIGIDWTDSHLGNIGWIGNRVVLIDMGILRCQGTHYEHLDKTVQSVSENVTVLDPCGNEMTARANII